MSFFSSIHNFFEYIVDFFRTFLTSLADALEILRSFLVFPPILQGYMPLFLSSCISVIMSISVVKWLVGR